MSSLKRESNSDNNHNAKTYSNKTCTCGHHYGIINNQSYMQSISSTRAVFPLDTSFVQIPYNVNAPSTATNTLQSGHHDTTTHLKSKSPSDVCSNQKLNLRGWNNNHNFEYINGVKKLYHTAVATSGQDLPALCQRCVKRVEKALENDTDRLLAESLLYEQAIRDDEMNRKSRKQVMYQAAMNIIPHNMNDNDEHEVITSEFSTTIDDVEHDIDDVYLREIHLLELACQEHRDELQRLRSIQKEQVITYDEIEQYAESMAAEQNALELEALAFDNDQEQLTRILTEVQDEMERLSSTNIRLPTSLVQLQIDVERGLRYPLINELRLAYRPKGDVHWKEIQVAWALASYLLLVIATVFDFQSQHWKIVPLSNCAKLIYCPPQNEIATADTTQVKDRKNMVHIFNLGHPKTNGSKALLSWNSLLSQVIQHVTGKTKEAVQCGLYVGSEISPIPFEISPTSIGGIVLTQLNENDDSRWSRVIHCMASNLQWLSKCASTYMLQQVILVAPLAKAVSETDEIQNGSSSNKV